MDELAEFFGVQPNSEEAKMLSGGWSDLSSELLIAEWSAAVGPFVSAGARPFFTIAAKQTSEGGVILASLAMDASDDEAVLRKMTLNALMHALGRRRKIERGGRPAGPSAN